MARRFISMALLALIAFSTLPPAPRAAEAQVGGCVFTLGFATLRDMILAQYGDIVGACLENEWHNAFNGDALQQTTGGLMVWRKADNWTAFTNGSLTWLNGPFGLAVRPNEGPLFAWEAPPPAGPAPAPAPPAPAPSGPTATPIPSDALPVITNLGVPDDDIDNGESFTIRIEASDDKGIDIMWWWATSTDDGNLRDTHEERCRGVTVCSRNWEVSTTDSGRIEIHALVKDTAGQTSAEVVKEIRVEEPRAATPTPTTGPASKPGG